MQLFQFFSFFAIILGFYFWGVTIAKNKAALVGGYRNLNSLPQYFGYLPAIVFATVSTICLIIWKIFELEFIKDIVIAKIDPNIASQYVGNEDLFFNELNMIQFIDNPLPEYQKASDLLKHYESMISTWSVWLVFVFAASLSTVICLIINRLKSVRILLERVIRIVLIICSTIAIFTTVGIVLSLLFEAINFFKLVSLFDFLFGTNWNPQTAIRSDQIAAQGSFGSIPLFLGTLQISILAMFIAVPIGLFSAIYLAEYSQKKHANFIKPVLEILAGIPTVVYGFFAALMVGPLVRDLAVATGLNASSESMLGTSLVMGLMIVPFVCSLSHDVINAVPQNLRDGAFAIGSTKSEMIKRVVLPAALPGIVSSVLLALSRAIGETMIVVMAAGVTANLTMNPLESVTTVTVQIVSLLVGDQEFDSAKTLAAFALGLQLFVVTLVLNIIALRVVKRYREVYE